MPVLSNARHERFAQELASGKTATEAYITAGYKPDDGNASKLAGKPEVQARVQEITGVAAEKVGISKAWVMQRLVENAERAMQAKAVTDATGQVVGDYQYQGSVANRALELIGKELGMFVERREVGEPGEFAAMDDYALQEAIQRAAAEAGVDIDSGSATQH